PEKAPKRDGDHGCPWPVLAISTQSKKGHFHDTRNSGLGPRHWHGADNSLCVWSSPAGFDVSRRASSCCRAEVSHCLHGILALYGSTVAPRWCFSFFIFFSQLRAAESPLSFTVTHVTPRPPLPHLTFRLRVHIAEEGDCHDDSRNSGPGLRHHHRCGA